MTGQKPRDLKLNNQRRVLDIVRQHDAITVAEITEISGQSRTIVMRAIRAFQEKGVINSEGKGTSTDEGGKRPELFAFNSSYAYLCVVHVFPFPQSITCCITDLSGNIVAQNDRTIDNDDNCKTVSTIISELAGECLASHNITKNDLVGMAVGTHGIVNFDSGDLIFSPHFPAWKKNANFADMLRDLMGVDIPIYVDNQIRFQTIAEKQFGIARDYSNIVVVEAGYGLVAGVMVDNKIQRGRNYLVGEIGHMHLDPDETATCHCGNTGCFETKVEIDRLIALAKAGRDAHSDSTIFQSSELTIQAIFDASNSGDMLACNIVDEAATWFAHGLTNATLMFDPEIIVIQGVYSEAGDYFIQQLRTHIKKGLFASLDRIPIIEYSPLDSTCIAGAADFVIDDYFLRF